MGFATYAANNSRANHDGLYGSRAEMHLKIFALQSGKG